MSNCNLIVLSYHRFGWEESNYPFSRTYKQFELDLVKKDFDWITIDDGSRCLIKACAMLEERNIRAKVFISTANIGQPNYCTWDEIWKISRKHDIENHSHDHVRLTDLTSIDVHDQIARAQILIKQYTGRIPRYFAAPWNQYNVIVDKAVSELGLQSVKDRVNIKNDTR